MRKFLPLNQIFDRRLSANVASLYLARATGILVPLAMLPLLARLLEPGEFGLMLLALALGMWIVQIVEYGYDLSATRRLSRTGWSGPGWKIFAWETLLGQSLLAAACLAATLLLALLAGPFMDAPALALLAWLYGALAGLAPRWYFYAREDLTGFNAVSILSRIAGAALSIVLAAIFATAQAVMTGYAVGSTLLLLWSFAKILPEIRGSSASLRAGLGSLRDGFGIFVFKLSKITYSLGGVSIAGLAYPPATLAPYAAADRLVRAGLNLGLAFSIAYYPRLTHLIETDRAAAARLALTLSVLAIGTTTLGAALVSFQSPFLVRLILGEAYGAAAPLLSMLVWVAPLSMAQYCLGTQWLLPLGKDRSFSAITLCCALLYLVMAALAAGHGLEALILANIVAELILCLALAFYALIEASRTRRVPV